MAKYWVYLNDKVAGPFELDQLIKVPGFSRQTQVSVDDMSGGAGKWISPAAIPELARIFQKVDEINEAPVAAPRPAPKPKPKIPLKLTPVAPPVEEKSSWYANGWLWLLLVVLLGGGGVLRWTQITQRKERGDERETARTLVETAPLPATSQYSSIRQYLQSKQISSRWEFDRQPTGVYNVSLSWMEPGRTRLPVYAFEVNLQVQSVRGLNTAGTQLLAEGFPPPAPPPKAASAAPKKSPGDSFPSAINDRRQAFEQGDFDAVWESYSRRRQSEMEQGGISRSGFIRMQKLTYKLSPGMQQSIVKTKTNSDKERLVLLRQTQPKHPDIYIKQNWVWEDNSWRLDDEEKKTAGAPERMVPGAENAASREPKNDYSNQTTFSPQVPAPAAASTPVPSATRKVPSNLPGLSESPASSR